MSSNSTTEIVTSDLSRFGPRERGMAARLLTASTEHGFPSDFDDDGVTVMMNTNSGYVFLTNAGCEVAMMNGDRLESFYNCGYCGHEGFADEFEHEAENRECVRAMRGVRNANGSDEADGDA